MENLMICPEAEKCKYKCKFHGIPHREGISCKDMCRNNLSANECIPYTEAKEAKMFKVGDKVRLVSHDEKWTKLDGLQIGGIYTVRQTFLSRLSFQICEPTENNYWYKQESFQLAEEDCMDDKYVAACKVIDGMKSICGEGKKEVKKLAASLLGVEVKEEHHCKTGDVFSDKGTILVIVSTGFGGVGYVMTNLSEGGSWRKTGKEPSDFNEMVKEYKFIGHASEVLRIVEK